MLLNEQDFDFKLLTSNGNVKVLHKAHNPAFHTTSPTECKCVYSGLAAKFKLLRCSEKEVSGEIRGYTAPAKGELDVFICKFRPRRCTTCIHIVYDRVSWQNFSLNLKETNFTPIAFDKHIVSPTCVLLTRASEND